MERLERDEVQLGQEELARGSRWSLRTALVRGQPAMAKGPQPTLTPTQAARLEVTIEREAAYLRALDHPAVPKVLGLWRGPDASEWLLLSRREGRSLDRIVRVCLEKRGWQGARLWDDATREIVRQVGQALLHAHSRGLYHGDLAPEHVRVAIDPHGELDVSVLGWGGGEDSPIGTSGTGGSTLAFAAPERLEGQPPSVASDVFALGVLVYHLLTGTTPWRETDPQGANPVRARVARQTPAWQVDDDKARAAWQLVSRTPVVAQALQSALAWDPKQRPATVRELLDRLGARGLVARPARNPWLILTVTVALGLGGLAALPPDDSVLTRALLERPPVDKCLEALTPLARQVCQQVAPGEPGCVQAATFLVGREECPNRLNELRTCLELR